ncbi:MAG TPA: type II secretion system protein [Gaiellaceae bacterium]|nr:type II secretion system protein [Gaiellaceae bacterium]
MPIPLFVRVRLAEEKGFGLIELLAAILMLNIGILALMGAFNSGAFALRRSATTSSGTAVADKVMEVYRDVKNCGIYLTGGTGNDVSGMPNGIPNSTSTWYSAYHGDTAAYASVAYFSNATPASTPLWVIDSTSGTGYAPIPASSSGCIPTGLTTSTGIDPTKAVQKVTGPDGLSYTAFSYIVIVQPSGYAKQVTVEVFNPHDATQLLARESSIFDPNVAP